jgi:hypothetical protein
MHPEPNLDMTGIGHWEVTDPRRTHERLQNKNRKVVIYNSMNENNRKYTCMGMGIANKGSKN